MGIPSKCPQCRFEFENYCVCIYIYMHIYCQDSNEFGDFHDGVTWRCMMSNDKYEF